MAKRPRRRPHLPPNRSAPDHPRPPHTLLRALGVVGLAVALLPSLMLAVDQLGGVRLPGCGPQSACAQAAASRWGKLPLVNWPVSFLGLAYFTGLLFAWLTSRSGPSGSLRVLVRTGVLGSVLLSIVLVIEGLFCPYCLLAHAGNLMLWIIVELFPRAPARDRNQNIKVAATFAVITAMLVPFHWRAPAIAEQRAEDALARSSGEIIDTTMRRVGSSEDTAADAGAPAAQPVAGVPDQPAVPADVESTSPVAPAPDKSAPPPFTGRYRIGPTRAPIRIVIFSDYQCRDCREIESQIASLLEQRDDVSLSIKQFPMSSVCNPHATRNLHPNACWAARAAEAAGILRGDEGFWEMHRWLFERRGGFTDRELDEGLHALGYEPRAFTRVMTSDQTLRRVQADIDEGVELGLHFTPMIFINGVELRGWNARDAVKRAVEALAAANPPPMSAAADRPPEALEKYIEDWRSRPRQRVGNEQRWLFGEAGAAVRVVLFGDYREKNTALADRLLRRMVAGGASLRYQFRHYPFDQACNPGVSSTRHPLACRAAQAVEAAARLGGQEARRGLHVWLLEHQDAFDDDASGAAAAELGLDPAEFVAAMELAEVRAPIREDSEFGKRLSLNSIPSLFINGKFVPRWRMDEEPILEELIIAAAAEE